MSNMKDDRHKVDEQKPERMGVSADTITDSREHVAGMIGLLCYYDKELCESLKKEGFTDKNLDIARDQLMKVYEILGRPRPDLSWMDTVKLSVVLNDDENYTIPLPHQT